LEKGNAVKNLIKKNQLMITALAIMIAIAGYLQFAGTNLEKEYLASDNTEDLSAVDSTDIVTDMESLDSDVEIVMEDYLDEDMQVAEATPDEGEIPGEAVLTGTNGVEVLSAARLSKEQTRARNKETLLEIINSTELSDAQKQEAVDSMVRMTDIAEKEAAVLLQAKGFSEAVVSINGDAVDVVVNAAELTDVQRAQIEDIVKRKTDIAAENIVISTIAQ
jgi:stage III sporulation protein AH